MRRKTQTLLAIGLVLLIASFSLSCRYDYDSRGQLGGQNAADYLNTKTQITSAVIAYATQPSHAGAYPINVSAGTYPTSVCTCYLIDMKLLLEGDILREVPTGCYAAAGSNNDNCDGGAIGCSDSNHYVWLIDSVGNVYSVCVGNGCASNNTSYYQGVWP